MMCPVKKTDLIQLVFLGLALIHWNGLALAAENGQRELELTLAGPAGKIGASLFLPASSSKSAGVVLVGRSGASDRNGNGVLRAQAEFFAQNGLAVLTYDKRGTGKSEGNWKKASFKDLAADAALALKALSERPEVDANRVGVWGISQGGWVIAELLSAGTNPDFVILASAGAAGISLAEQFLHNVIATLKADGADHQALHRAEMAWKALYQNIRNAGIPPGLDQAIEAARRHGVASDLLPPKDEDIRWTNMDQWFLALDIDYNPVQVWSSYQGSFLAAFGGADHSTPVARVVPRLQSTLQDGPAADYEIHTIPAADHTFSLATQPNEEYLSLLRGWLEKKGLIPAN